MMKVGQWWQAGDGSIFYILVITTGIKGIPQLSNPVIAIDEYGNVEQFTIDGRRHCKENSDLDLRVLLPKEYFDSEDVKEAI